MMSRWSNVATVGAISALLIGAGSAKCRRKSGPNAAMKFRVSERLKLPCIPWPVFRDVSAYSAAHSSNGSQPGSADEPKLKMIAG
jgi:hypothetical protein